jgi:hypothetical protein
MRTFTLSLTLILTLAIGVSCSSDDSSEESSSKEKTEKVASESKEDAVTSESSVVEDNLEELVKFSKTQCSTIETEYASYSSAGSSEDGFSDISDVREAMFYYGYDISEEFYSLDWKDEDTSDIQAEMITPVIALSDQSAVDMQRIVDASTSNSQSAEQVAQVHDIVKAYVADTNALGFGPCTIK